MASQFPHHLVFKYCFLKKIQKQMPSKLIKKTIPCGIGNVIGFTSISVQCHQRRHANQQPLWGSQVFLHPSPTLDMCKPMGKSLGNV